MKIVTLTISDATTVSGFGRTTIKGRISDGTLRSILLNGRRLIYYDSLLEFLNGGPAD